MRLGVLFSGGKDSCFACYKAMGTEEVVCLISVLSKNPESYMFHTPNIELTGLQAEAMGLPLVAVETEGKKEEELDDLKRAVQAAKEKHGIEGVVSGAVLSVYQATRIQRICNALDLWCFNPLWHSDQAECIREFVSSGFEAMISGVFAYPFDEGWLGRRIDEKTIEDLIKLSKKFGISPIGEGGELETFVLNGPIFRKRIKILETSRKYENHSGICYIKKAVLVEK